jgi:hypothetical protein
MSHFEVNEYFRNSQGNIRKQNHRLEVNDLITNKPRTFFDTWINTLDILYGKRELCSCDFLYYHVVMGQRISIRQATARNGRKRSPLQADYFTISGFHRSGDFISETINY